MFSHASKMFAKIKKKKKKKEKIFSPSLPRYIHSGTSTCSLVHEGIGESVKILP
jgi:hypothetical protein